MAVPGHTVDTIVQRQPQPGLYHGIGGKAVHGGKLQIGPNAAFGKHAGVVNIHAGVGFNIRLCGKALDRKRIQCGQRMPGGHPGHHFIPAQRQPAVFALALADNTQIKLARVQLGGQLAAVAAAKLHLNAGITVVKFTDHTGQPVIIGAVGGADHHGAHIQPANLRGKLGAGFAAVQQSVNAGQQPLAGSGRAHAAMLSQQQGKTALCFQRTDHTADARGGVLQFFCCRGKAAALDGAYQRTVFFQFHGLPLSLRICQNRCSILSLYAKHTMPLY